MLGARSHIQHQAPGGLPPGSSQPSGEKEAAEVTKPQGHLGCQGPLGQGELCNVDPEWGQLQGLFSGKASF